MQPNFIYKFYIVAYEGHNDFNAGNCRNTYYVRNCMRNGYLLTIGFNYQPRVDTWDRTLGNFSIPQSQLKAFATWRLVL